MKLPKPVLLVVAALIVVSCSNKPQKLNDETYSYFVETGSEISAQAQAALLSKVSEAMKQGGTVYAVEFCNLEVSGITDSLNNRYNCRISRVSDKNRNAENALANETERLLWDYFLSVQDTKMVHDTVISLNNRNIYYKPIMTAMQTCLRCHGQVEEIDPATVNKIKELYPQDKATGYQLNEMRGLWKIVFEKNHKAETESNGGKDLS